MSDNLTHGSSERKDRSAAHTEPRRAVVVSTPRGFSVYDGNDKHVATFKFGRASEAWELARDLDREAIRHGRVV